MYVQRAPGENSNNTLISAEIHGVPDNVTFSVGQRINGGIVKLSEEDLSNVKMSFKGDQDDFKLKMIVSITSKSSPRNKRSASDTGNGKRSRSFEFDVTGKGSLQPTLVIPKAKTCFSKDKSKLELKYSVGISRGSADIVRLIISNLPDGFGVFEKSRSTSISNISASYVIQNASSFDSFVIEGPFSAMKTSFNVTVTASASPAFGEILKVVKLDECSKSSK